MQEIHVILLDGSRITLEGQIGMNAMNLIRNVGVDDLAAICGGACSCGTCHVYVDAAYFDLLSPIGHDENELLAANDRRGETSRLACQIEYTRTLSGITVTLAPEG
jgi:2Fe-2S ferredoxin